MQIAEMDKPVPNDNEVLVKVFAVSLNEWDWGMLHGTTLFDRLMYGLKRPKRQVLGSDIAGIVEAVGKDVTRFRIGDEVFGDMSGRWGGFAEYACAAENMLDLKPASMRFDEAAAIPQAGMLAVQGLIDKGRLRAGQKLLINGAGGGVGTFALQIAKLYDVDVTSVDSAEKLGMLRSMGSKQVIDYATEDFTQSNKQYDLILDVKTNRPIADYLRALAPGGTYVTVGGSLSRLLRLFLLGGLVSIFTRKKLKIVALKPNKDLRYMSELFGSGTVKPVIDGQYRLEDIHEAFRFYGRAAHKGKIVITVHDNT